MQCNPIYNFFTGPGNQNVKNQENAAVRKPKMNADCVALTCNHALLQV